MSIVQAIVAVWNELRNQSPRQDDIEPQQTDSHVPVVSPHIVKLPPEIATLPILPQVPPHVLNDALEENREKIWKYLFKRVEKAIVEDLDEIYLWRVQDTHLVLFLSNSQYAGCLDSMKDFFLKTEEYEYIPFCNELTDKLKVNEVIRASR